jgi:hypothetical protein
MVINPKVAHLKDRIISQVQELPRLGASASSCRTYAGVHQRSPGAESTPAGPHRPSPRDWRRARHASRASNSTSEVVNRRRTPRAMKLRCSAGLELTPRQPVASGFRAGDGPVNRAEVCATIVFTFGMRSRAASAAPQAALSGSNPKAPSFAGGYLPFGAPPAALAKLYRGLASKQS